MTQNYKSLVEEYRKVILYNHAMSILGWDQAVMMPSGGANARAEGLAFLSTQAHTQTVSDATYEVLQKAQDEKQNLTPEHQDNLDLMHYKIEKARLIPDRLVDEISRTSSQCEVIWYDARHTGDFTSVAPLVEKMVKLKQEQADILSPHLGCGRYEALMDGYDRGRRTADVDLVFSGLKKELPDILEQAVAKQGRQTLETQTMSIENQKKFGSAISENLGFDFKGGRLDVSAHPFSGGIPDDVRMTSRYEEEDFFTGLLAVVHEAGHGMYDQNMPRDWRYLAIGQSFNMGMTGHESMSLFIEQQIALRPAFLKYLAKLAKDTTDISVDYTAMLARAHHVSRSFIRVYADEVTYPIHIILRYEIERDLIDGKLNIKDVPEIWNTKMKDYLGITPENNAMGCMQDIHWYQGAFGYFPCYSLGAMTASQYYRSMTREMPSIDENIVSGDFAPIQNWLKTNIYKAGSRITADALLNEVTGEALNPKYHLDHLKSRYTT